MSKLDMPRAYHKTKSGAVYLADSLNVMRAMKPRSIDLVMTSPPFGLTREKEYGNVREQAYLDWFRGFAHGFQRVLKDNGSLVIDIGGAWKPGRPVRSLYHFKLLIMLLRGIRVPSRSGVLLVESVKAANAGGMGEHSTHSSKGRGQHRVVAVERRMATCKQPSCSSAL